MTKVSFLFTVCFLFPVFSLSQNLHLEENFDYETGVLTTLSDWEESPTGSTDIEVISGSLSYNEYPLSSIANKIFLDGGGARSGVKRNFSTISEDGNNVYTSFLFELTDLADLDISTNAGDYFFNYQSSTGSTNRAYVYIKQSATENKFNIGLAKSSATSLTYSPTDLDVDTTHLIVVSYVFQSGSDEIRLWINPDLSGAEPSPEVSLTSGTDASDIAYIQFRQREFSGNIYIDGVRVADSWPQAPIPVELTSFTASVSGKLVTLKWITATELNNSGFEVQRSVNNSDWNAITFIEGKGTTASPVEYSYVDKSITSDKYFYRLKQIDLNGSYEYSSVIEVYAEVPKNEFVLEQNYPNPFNPTTNIRFHIPASETTDFRFVSLKVYDVLGNEIVTLVNEEKPAGNYEINFDASNLTSGIYLYKIQIGSFTDIKKFMLLK